MGGVAVNVVELEDAVAEGIIAAARGGGGGEGGDGPREEERKIECDRDGINNDVEEEGMTEMEEVEERRGKNGTLSPLTGRDGNDPHGVEGVACVGMVVVPRRPSILSLVSSSFSSLASENVEGRGGSWNECTGGAEDTPSKGGRETVVGVVDLVAVMVRGVIDGEEGEGKTGCSNGGANEGVGTLTKNESDECGGGWCRGGRPIIVSCSSSSSSADGILVQSASGRLVCGSFTVDLRLSASSKETLLVAVYAVGDDVGRWRRSSCSLLARRGERRRWVECISPPWCGTLSCEWLSMDSLWVYLGIDAFGL